MNPEQPGDFDDLFDDQSRSILASLSFYDVPIPEGLEQKILIAAKVPKLSVDGILQEFTSEVPSRRRLIFNRFWDFLATAAAIVLISSAILLSSGYVRQQSRKALCAGNLGILGSAITSYANDFYNQLPYAKIDQNHTWYDHKTKHPRRAHLFILIKKNYVSPQFLVCPEESSNIKPIPVKDLSSLSDFPHQWIVSYSFQNLYGDQKFTTGLLQLRWKQAQDMAVMADRTPLLRRDQLRTNLESDDVLSENHSGLKGQNILILDGRVIWQRSPLVGPRYDNIWKAGKIQRYFGKETPSDPTDIFLAP